MIEFHARLEKIRRPVQERRIGQIAAQPVEIIDELCAEAADQSRMWQTEYIAQMAQTHAVQRFDRRCIELAMADAHSRECAMQYRQLRDHCAVLRARKGERAERGGRRSKPMGNAEF